MKKRIFIVVMALVLFTVALTFTASAAAPVDSGSCGPNLSWVLDSSGVLTISGTGAMTNYDYDGSPWNGYRDLITTVVIGNGVTSIGNCAFWYCTNLTSAPIPDGVTSIGGWAFYNCTSLPSVDLPGSVTSVGNSAFAFCPSVSLLRINSKFSSNHNSFHECTALTTLSLGSSVTGFAQNFLNNLYALTTITVDSGNSKYSAKDGLLLSKDGGTLIFCPLTRAGSLAVPAGVTTIGEMAFYDCNKLTSVTLPESVRSIGKDAFLHCTGLTSVNIPESVTTIGEGAFYGCTRLTSMNIPGSVTTIGVNSFSKCTRLSSLTIGNGVENIEVGAFEECTKLADVNIPVSVIKLGNFAFADSGLTSVHYDGTETQWKALLATGSNQLPAGVSVSCSRPQLNTGTARPNKPPAPPASGSTSPSAQGNGAAFVRNKNGSPFMISLAGGLSCTGMAAIKKQP